MKTRMTIIAAAVVMLFAGGQMALAAQQLHEDEWDKVNLYGSTTIAGDSVDDWGPWKEFVQPAAGAPTVALLGGLGGPLYTPLAQVTQEFTGCEAGALCGYVSFVNLRGSANIYDGGEGGPYSMSSSRVSGGLPFIGDLGNVHVTNFEVYGKYPAVLTGGFDGGEGGPIVSWRIAAIDGTPYFTESGEMSERYGPVFYRIDESGGDGSGSVDAAALLVAHQHDEVGVGALGAGVINYVTGYHDYEEECSDCGYSQTDVDGSATVAWGMGGRVTSAIGMAEARSANMVAYYFGNDITVLGHPGIGVVPQNRFAMKVNFGPGTWNGAWNPDKYLDYKAGALPTTMGDGYVVALPPDSAGRVNLVGQVGFDASGTINGSNFKSTQVSAPDGQVSGTVYGSFFGMNEPQTVGGVTDITKTKSQVPNGVATIQTTPQPSYTSGKYVAPFVSTKSVVVSPQLDK